MGRNEDSAEAGHEAFVGAIREVGLVNDSGVVIGSRAVQGKNLVDGAVVLGGAGPCFIQQTSVTCKIPISCQKNDVLIQYNGILMQNIQEFDFMVLKKCYTLYLQSCFRKHHEDKIMSKYILKWIQGLFQCAARTPYQTTKITYQKIAIEALTCVERLGGRLWGRVTGHFCVRHQLQVGTGFASDLHSQWLLRVVEKLSSQLNLSASTGTTEGGCHRGNHYNGTTCILVVAQ